jgi:hypothetical protein
VCSSGVVVAPSGAGFDGKRGRTGPEVDLESDRVDDVEETTQLRGQLSALERRDHVTVRPAGELTQLSLREAGLPPGLTDRLAEFQR